MESSSRGHQAIVYYTHQALCLPTHLCLPLCVILYFIHIPRQLGRQTGFA